MQVPVSQSQGHKSSLDSEALAISTAMVCYRMVIKFHLRVSERTVLCGPTFDAHAPSFEGVRCERSAHHLYDLGLRDSQALLDGFEAGSVLPGHLNQGRHVAFGQIFVGLMFHKSCLATKYRCQARP